MPTFRVTSQVSLASVGQRAVVQDIVAPTIEEAIRIAKEEMITVTVQRVETIAP